ncbi:MAG: ACT domain-containing protein [Chloroflexota bacterium]
MSGETNLNKLLATMAPQLLEDEYVFVTVENGRYGEHATLSPIASFMEAEGLTLVLTKSNADKEGLSYEGSFRCITLLVHSSLEAVGLTAAVATKLAAHQISANVIAGYYHDHIFIQATNADRAMSALHTLSQENQRYLLRFGYN